MRNALNWPVSCAVKNHQGAESEENLLHPDGWDGLWDQPWGLPVPSVVPQCAQCGCKEKQLLGIFFSFLESCSSISLFQTLQLDAEVEL